MSTSKMGLLSGLIGPVLPAHHNSSEPYKRKKICHTGKMVKSRLVKVISSIGHIIFGKFWTVSLVFEKWLNWVTNVAISSFKYKSNHVGSGIPRKNAGICCDSNKSKFPTSSASRAEIDWVFWLDVCLFFPPVVLCLSCFGCLFLIFPCRGFHRFFFVSSSLLWSWCLGNALWSSDSWRSWRFLDAQPLLW